MLDKLVEQLKDTKKFPLDMFKEIAKLDICKCKSSLAMVINQDLVGRRPFEQQVFGNKGFGRNFKKQYSSKPHYNNNNFTRGGPGMVKRGSHKQKFGHNGIDIHKDEIVRNPISQSTIDMRDKADKWKSIINETDKQDIEKKAKALLNKITPDNYKKLK